MNKQPFKKILYLTSSRRKVLALVLEEKPISPTRDEYNAGEFLILKYLDVNEHG